MDKKTKYFLNGFILSSSIAIVVALLGCGYILTEISSFQSAIQDELDEFQFYSSDSWGVMLRGKTIGFRAKRQYSNAPVGGGGPIEDGTCQCAQQSSGCLPGPRGEAGTDGLPGESGSPGEPGRPGSPGTRDFPFSVGNGCIPCPQGAMGSPGPDGPPGPPGPNGNPGNPGVAGLPGQQGPPGTMGSPGPDGNPGASGTIGSPGAIGTRSINPPGPCGAVGSMGPSGPPGRSGQLSIGLPGPPGNMGPPGNRGFNGDPGQPGSPGAAGRPGTDGQYCPCPSRTPNLGVNEYGYQPREPETADEFLIRKKMILKKLTRNLQKKFTSA